MSASVDLNELEFGYSKEPDGWEQVEWDGLIVNKTTQKITFLRAGKLKDFSVSFDDPGLTVEIP